MKLKKSDELLKAKDKEITNIKIELKNAKNHFEKEVKKLKKAQDSNLKRTGGGFSIASNSKKLVTSTTQKSLNN